jgi:hypothetical protein
MKALKVKTYPRHLREQIEVNVERLEIGENVRVEDVKDENFEIINSPRIPIASVVTTRALRQEEASADKAAPKGAAPAKAAAPAAAPPARQKQHRQKIRFNFFKNSSRRITAGFFWQLGLSKSFRFFAAIPPRETTCPQL